MAIMDVMAIAAVMPILTIISRMATMTLIFSFNFNYESCYIINNFLYGYGHNGNSCHNRGNDPIDCYEHIVVMIKHSLVALKAILSFMTLLDS